MKKRIKYLSAFILLVAIECLIAIFLKRGFIRENIGDVLVVPCIYLMLRVIFPDKIKYLSVYVLAFAIIVEILQLLEITKMIAGSNRVLSIALGGTFDIKDIFCYVLGFILIVVFSKIKKLSR